MGNDAMNELPSPTVLGAAMYAVDTAARGFGVKLEVLERGRAEATMLVRPDMLNGLGVCHGAYLFALADTTFAYACNSYNRVSFAQAAQIHFVQAGRAGETLRASAVERSLRGRAGVYDVEVRNPAGGLVALFRGESVATDRELLAAVAPK
ncbi:MAG: hydroxyphenylacetyl-CoA thioesterase PaaI [Gammaproteobacteria bacterium]|nr:hydroxyphenylacetyl-CoA thioesterase PaaI [Gammaproteobacteria bacterium]